MKLIDIKYRFKRKRENAPIPTKKRKLEEIKEKPVVVPVEKKTREKKKVKSHRKKHPKPTCKSISLDYSSQRRLKKFLKAVIHYEKDHYGLEKAEEFWKTWCRTVDEYLIDFEKELPNQENVLNQARLDLLNYQISLLDKELNTLKRVDSMIQQHSSISKDHKFPTLEGLQNQFRKKLQKDDAEFNQMIQKFQTFQEMVDALNDTMSYKRQQLQSNIYESEERQKETVSKLGATAEKQPGHEALREFLED